MKIAWFKSSAAIRRIFSLCPVVMMLLIAPFEVGEGMTAVGDFTSLSQNPLSWLDTHTENVPLLSGEDQARLNEESDKVFFSPWHRQEPHHGKKYASWGVKKFSGHPGYGKDGKPHTAEWIRKIIHNAHTQDYPLDSYPAIVVESINLRLLPSEESHFNLPSGGHRSAAFDNFQQSLIPAGTPLLVTLASRDRRWLLVETDHLIGWVRAEGVARVDQDFVKTWENGRYVAIIKDKTPITVDKKVIYSVPLGSVFPMVGKEMGEIWIPKRDPQGNAVLTKGSVPARRVALKPLLLTPRNVASLAGELVGGEYGWGGLNGKRDCSSTIRDLFSPFGILLPRNSVDQAGAGRFVSFMGISPGKKESIIVKEGVPWRTLLWTPGHIMLYIGTTDGKPVIFHNFWKIAILGKDGKKGRLIVGRTAITSLFPGRELPNVDPVRADILAGLGGMTLLGERNENASSVVPPLEDMQSGGPDLPRY